MRAEGTTPGTTGKPRGRRVGTWILRIVLIWLAASFVIAAITVGAELITGRDDDSEIPDHWTDEYREQTWRDFNQGEVRDRFDRECVLSVIEDWFPNPRDAKPVFDASEEGDREAQAEICRVRHRSQGELLRGDDERRSDSAPRPL
jgi:hypothetical protein